MNSFCRLIRYNFFLLIFVLGFLATANPLNAQVRFKVDFLENEALYQVSLVSEVTYDGVDALTSTAQVALRVPTGGFQLANLQSVSGLWQLNTTILGPTENPDFDYFLIGMTSFGTGDISYIEGEETILFTFSNDGNCTGVVDLMEADDPFLPPNDQNINSGNEMFIFGSGNQNAWLGNLGQGSANCLPDDDNNTDDCDKPITFKIELLDDQITYQVSLKSDTNYSGVDALTNSAQVSILAPTGQLEIANLQSINGSWGNNTNVFGPDENPDVDYFLVGLLSNGTNDLEYVAGEYLPLFTFENASTCADSIYLMNADDPFYPPNNQGINAGNEIVVFGFGNENAWCENEGPAAACPGTSDDDCTQPIEYTLRLLPDGETYEVLLRSQETYTGVDALTNSAQVCVRVPTGGFSVTELESINGQWSLNTEVSDPDENPGTDYLIFGLISNGTNAISYEAGMETALFQFKNGGICTGDLSLMESDDPFYPPNNLGINAGNEIVVFGNGNQNAWCGNYGDPAPCAIDTGCTQPIEYTLRLLPDGETYEVLLRSQETYTGVDALTNSAQVCVRVPTGGFSVTELESINGQWSLNTEVSDPDENPGTDYLIFGLISNGTNAISYEAGMETALFQFKNGGICTGDLSLMESDDPFYPPNNLGINAGNEIVVFGNGNQNAWCGNYGDPAPCAIDTGCTQPIEYTLRLLPDGETYEVLLRSQETYTGVDALTNSAQVCVRVPTGGFSVTELESINGQWSLNTEVSDPDENPGTDYLIFGLISNGTNAISYEAGMETALFQFKNGGICTGDLSLMESDDPFYPPNNLGINAGNEIVVFGNGNQNAWCGNYGDPAPCAIDTGCTQPIEYTLRLLPDGETYEVLLRSQETYTGVDALTNSAQVCVRVPTGGFSVTELESINGQWSLNTEVSDPDENPGTDYLIFGLISNGTNAISYEAGMETALFQFKNGGVCTGDLSLMESDDPFYPPNNLGINAGNEIVVFGNGNQNAWCGNYGDPAPCAIDTGCTQPIEYTLRLLPDGETYEVLLRSQETYTGVDALTNSAQVCVRVPTGGFSVTELESINGQWSLNTEVSDPDENPGTDYLIFGLISNGTNAISYEAGMETALFQFKNGGICTGDLSLMESDDPFYPPNNLGINAGNEIVVFGNGNQNAWCGNYGDPAPCDIDTGCTQPIEYTLRLLPDGETYEVLLRSQETYTGVDALTNSAQVCVRVPTGGFSVTELESINGQWSLNTEVSDPDENPGTDYLIFGLISNGTNAISYEAGMETALFQFKNGGICTGDLSLMESDDPFYPPNNLGINAGNEIVVFGNGNQNAWCGNYGDPAPCDLAPIPLSVAPRVFLQGPFDEDNQLMNDGLRANGLIPLMEPYTELGIEFGPNHPYTHVGGGGETIMPAVLDIIGPDAIVDWVFLELRDAIDPSEVKATRSALIQRDGDIVDVDGISPVVFDNQMPGNYHLVIRHRNHLGIMSANTIMLGMLTAAPDFTTSGNSTFGVLAQMELPDGTQLMWAGDINSDQRITLVGADNDLEKLNLDMINAPGNNQSSTNFIMDGYFICDTDMDGTAIYQGPGNDAVPIVLNVMLHPLNAATVFNYVIQEQIP